MNTRADHPLAKIPKLNSIQALRGVAVFTVLLVHAMFIEQKYSHGDKLLSARMEYALTAVDLFFVLSGFIMVTVSRGKFGTANQSLKFLIKRVARIYPIYWFYTLLTLAIFLFRPGMVNSSEGHRAEILASFLLFPSEHMPLVLVGWSLIFEMWFYLVFAGLLLLKEHVLVPALMLWSTVVIVCNLSIQMESLGPIFHLAMHVFSLEFIMGALCGVFVTTNAAKQIPPSACWGAMALVLVVLTPLGYSLQIERGTGFTRALFCGSSYTLLMLAAVLLEKMDRLPRLKPLAALGDWSYTIYLSHTLVLSAIGRMWYRQATGQSLIDNAIVLPLMLTAVVIYGWVGYRYIEQPTNRLINSLFHEAKKRLRPPQRAPRLRFS